MIKIIITNTHTHTHTHTHTQKKKKKKKKTSKYYGFMMKFPKSNPSPNASILVRFMFSVMGTPNFPFP